MFSLLLEKNNIVAATLLRVEAFFNDDQIDSKQACRYSTRRRGDIRATLKLYSTAQTEQDFRNQLFIHWQAISSWQKSVRNKSFCLESHEKKNITRWFGNCISCQQAKIGEAACKRSKFFFLFNLII